METTVASIQAAIDADSITARTLTEWHLDRIEEHDDSLNAIITVNDDAISRADALDREYADAGRVGPLHGVPVILKDNVDTADLPTTGGSVTFADHHPTEDAYITQQLRAAGAIILAKANLHELARAGTTVSSLGGQTHNPYVHDRTPGGSSGGTGAAIAANYGVLGIGTDTVNSIRSPASACNLVGLRPTRGLVSRRGIMPAALTQDTAGPITRTVADAARMLTVLAGYDPADPVTARSKDHLTTYEAQLEEFPLTEVRVGILESLFGDGPEFAPVTAIIESAITALREAGATTTDVATTFDIDRLSDRIDVQRWEGQSNFNTYLDDHESPPVDTYQAFVHHGDYHPSIQENLLSAYGIDSPTDYRQYLDCLHQADELRDRLHGVFAADDLDVLVFPHQQRPVAQIGDTQRDRNGFLASGSGFPAITVPAGFTESGIPVGIEFLARPFQEAKLLSIAHAFEQTTHHRRPPDLDD